MTDTFKTFARSLTAPPEPGAEIGPSDTAPPPHLPRALHVGGSGDVALRLAPRGLQAGTAATGLTGCR